MRLKLPVYECTKPVSARWYTGGIPVYENGRTLGRYTGTVEGNPSVRVYGSPRRGPYTVHWVSPVRHAGRVGGDPAEGKEKESKKDVDGCADGGMVRPMSIPHNTTPSAQSNQFRVICDFGEWRVQGTDNNGVWQSAEPGATYADQDEAEAAAEAWAENRGGKFIGVFVPA